MKNPHIIAIDTTTYPEKAFIVSEEHIEKGLITGDVVVIDKETQTFKMITDEQIAGGVIPSGVYVGRVQQVVEKNRILTADQILNNRK